MAMNMTNFMAVKDDGDEVLGKILYYSLSSLLIDKVKLTEICSEMGFPYSGGKRLALADAFRSATGDICDSKVADVCGEKRTVKIYCRDNRSGGDGLSRELIKETLDHRTNEYKKLANLTFSRDYGFSYGDLAYDGHVDPMEYCEQAQRLFDLYQVCAGRKQVETILETYIDSLSAVKVVAHGRLYFVPRAYMHGLDVFEMFIGALEENNLHSNKKRAPLDANAMYVVDDEKQRQKMAAAFYRSVRRDIAEYSERAGHLIQSGSQSPAIMERWIARIDALRGKKREYEGVLQRELGETDEDFQSLSFLAQELQIRARGIRLKNCA
jgi:hypothetical protein